ncbi:MAG: phosphocarrier protein HPr [Verrucomicrobia bacterium CG_4_10_14_3_um_filter_43_23]|nr:MAG: phosphocarrier protein HPr [Verrucomicrobia bacterium CG1_02_43_26]PIP58875.1 MAG: phosphocarrier protein HPr [Verrucomicrobia bacterium CG22_combo_CG10-13_8_21_14_all_43_17]PIX57777.1 MAG: phosphocarrier protein HPr [Verrucomicrobia bacterium CG_4_10_14_3_um_filter_43_23]PIY61091.1 MAG: phosphocarrier protein HPr [Verrucomicrobia bacterium CG_4_10_14_0_8_um_filter_43_34]PJA44247.1 MAG: phosphocarrier protein HPr [Verrucomicrobia bacterium CG_4_9_14_3_um_filter_43_20]
MESSDVTAAKGAKERTLIVKNKMGIHARPAAMIVRVSNRYNDTEVWIRKNSEEINAKSIMGLMMLAAAKGSELLFIADGPGADALLDEMEDLFDRQFEEM